MSPEPVTPSLEAEEIVDHVRQRYGALAREGGSCCGPTADAATLARTIGYQEADLAELPADANLGLGCGAPVPLLELQPGETVLDLGSGPGLDAMLAARAVGPTGHVIGVDMTPEMIDRATAAAARLGLDHVEFRPGRLEALPVDDASVDAVTSNCVLNLVPDKAAVFREIARVLKPGGRLVVADLVLDRPLPEAVASDLAAWAGCVAGAMPREDYFAALTDAGLGTPEVLRKTDYVGAWGETDPEGLAALAERDGTTPEELAGAIVSVTYRAVQPSSAVHTERATTTAPSTGAAPGVRLTVDYWTVAMEGQSSCGACDATLTALQDTAATIRPLAQRLGIAVDVVPRTVTTWDEALEHSIAASPTIRAQGIELRPAHPDGSETRRWHWRGATSSEAPAEALLDLLLRAVTARSAQLGGFLAAGGPAPYMRRFLGTEPPAKADQSTTDSCSCGAC